MGNERIRKGKTGNFKSSEIHLENACETMKERFTKLLLGGDMSGCGNGVSTALAVSNAITNLCATIFGHVWRLEPLPVDKKSQWRRELEWYLSVSDHILELVPCWQTFPDGSRQEVMKSRPRSDLYVNLPALRKLDNMLLGILDSFRNPEFWYVDKGIVNPREDKEDKWWLPVPRVPPGGLTENARKTLQHRRGCANQILKAATAINASVLAEMDIPNSYLDALPIPKNVKTSLGDLIHQYITSDQFTPESLLDSLDLASDHHALEIADRVEAAAHAWRRKTSSNSSYSKSSWESFKDFVSDADKKWEQMADRAETVLLCLKRRFPGMPQTTLSATKIKHNKDVGKSILESYSRVLERLAFNIVTRIEDLLYVDGLPNRNSVNNHQYRMSISNSIGSISGSPYRMSAFSSPSYSPNLLLFSPAKGNRSPLKLKRASIDCGGKGNGLRRNLFSPSPEQSSCGSKKASSRLRANE